MPRSPSPKRRGERVVRSRSKERDRDRRRRRSRDRGDRRDDRRHSPRRHSRDRHRRSWSRSRSRSPDDRKNKLVDTRKPISEADLEGKTPDEQEMMKLMGFCGFDTTKGKRVDNNDNGAVHVILKRKYRQYMNRKGGFNRPLDFVA
uniref:U4/U6.U5 small nuclear ribonucleoprotein 27 kDa protein n=1 Tax=Lygus hesperus TaxID=30085 RepID=A0A0A9XFC2_LYGHE